MFTWLVDNASTVYWLLGFTALAFVVAWYMTKRAKHLGFAGAALGVMALVFLLSRTVMTDRKQIEANLRIMAAAVVDDDAERLGQFFAKDFTFSGFGGEAAAKAVTQTARAHAVAHIHLWDFDCPELAEEKKEAKMNFKVRIDGGGDFWGAVQAQSTFVLEDERWKMRSISFHRLVGQQKEAIDIPLK